jgi:hypothetical protein
MPDLRISQGNLITLLGIVLSVVIASLTFSGTMGAARARIEALEERVITQEARIEKNREQCSADMRAEVVALRSSLQAEHDVVSQISADVRFIKLKLSVKE